MKLKPIENTTQLLLTAPFWQRDHLTQWMQRLSLHADFCGLEMVWSFKGLLRLSLHIKVTGGTKGQRVAFANTIAAECRT